MTVLCLSIYMSKGKYFSAFQLPPLNVFAFNLLYQTCILVVILYTADEMDGFEDDLSEASTIEPEEEVKAWVDLSEATQNTFFHRDFAMYNIHSE